MTVLGITGGIGCGKTTVSKELEALGARVIDADAISRALTKKGGVALPSIRASFGGEVFKEDGSLDRAKLAEIVFSNDEKRRRLESILHPLIRRKMVSELSDCNKSGALLVVLDVPLLFEAGFDALCDYTVCVTASDKTRFERLRARDGMTREQALARMRSEKPLETKMRLADATLDTDAPLPEVKLRVKALYHAVTASGRKGRA